MCDCMSGDTRGDPGNSEMGPYQLARQLRGTCKGGMPPHLENLKTLVSSDVIDANWRCL